MVKAMEVERPVVPSSYYHPIIYHIRNHCDTIFSFLFLWGKGGKCVMHRSAIKVPYVELRQGLPDLGRLAISASLG